MVAAAVAGAVAAAGVVAVSVVAAAVAVRILVVSTAAVPHAPGVAVEYAQWAVYAPRKATPVVLPEAASLEAVVLVAEASEALLQAKKRIAEETKHEQGVVHFLLSTNEMTTALV